MSEVIFKSFGSIEVGQHFIFDKTLYQKVPPVGKLKSNCVSPKDGHLHHIAFDTPIAPVRIRIDVLEDQGV